MHNELQPSTTRISLELAKTYAQLLRPFEDVWAQSLLKQQASILEAQRKASGELPVLPTTAARPTEQQTAAMANMSPQQLLSFGFNASQVEFMRQQGAGGQAGGPMAAVASAQALAHARANSMSSLKAHTTDPSLEQMSEARSVVLQLRAQVENNRGEFCSRREPWSGS